MLRFYILCVCIGVGLGFQCYTCSYDHNTPGPIDCLTSPEDLPDNLHIKCGNFCVTQEVFSIQDKIILSFFRTCSVDWGNVCTEDAWFVTCKTTCIGDFCNEGLTMDPDTHERPDVKDNYGNWYENSATQLHNVMETMLAILLIIACVT
ncbi:uncharacterized protein LOC125372370 [Haliotis rufescens]|uniref:uncharacterized protein LOC125372370 n=1 Tax=Haliotis rufescens TaxID=6454 RepID=UPI00201EA690|nr:uncharacterized protein LOC125372370 [Haliotis rufescens]